jgi:hypothetical protein
MKIETSFDKCRMLLLNVKFYTFILRLGVSATFIAHGLLALKVKPEWIPLITAFGFHIRAAENLLPLIGCMDIFTAIIILVRPFRAIVAWAAFWAFATALSRPISGQPILEFIERSSNWVLPLVLLWLMRFPKKWKELFLNQA